MNSPRLTRLGHLFHTGSGALPISASLIRSLAPSDPPRELRARLELRPWPVALDRLCEGKRHTHDDLGALHDAFPSDPVKGLRLLRQVRSAPWPRPTLPSTRFSVGLLEGSFPRSGTRSRRPHAHHPPTVQNLRQLLRPFHPCCEQVFPGGLDFATFCLDDGFVAGHADAVHHYFELLVSGFADLCGSLLRLGAKLLSKHSPWGSLECFGEHPSKESCRST